jgi:Porin PorA
MKPVSLVGRGQPGHNQRGTWLHRESLLSPFGHHEVLAEEADVPVRRSSIVLATIGIVLIVLAVVGRLVIVPIATELPRSTNLGVTYSGTGTLLNSAALQAGDTKNIIATNVPITVDRRLKVTGTHGDTAIVSDDLTIHAGAETLLSPHTYALNRTTLKGATPPSGISVEPSEGALSSTFPIGPKANDSYRYYDPTTRRIVPITYTGNGIRDGRSVNVYRIPATGEVRDPILLKMLPPALPKKLMAALAPLLPAAVRAKFTPATLAGLPNPVPLTYTGTTNIVAYVDKQTGVPIDETISEQIVVNVTAGSQSISLIPVLALDFHVTPASMKYLAHKAKTSGELLTLIKVIVPIVLIVIGIVLLVVAVIRRRRKLEPTAVSPSTDAESNPQRPVPADAPRR